MSHPKHAALSVWLVLFAGQALADSVYTPFPDLASTGTGLAESSEDVRFTLISAPAGVPTGGSPVVVRSTWDFGSGPVAAYPFAGGWFANTEEAQWIGVRDNYAYHNSEPSGTYVFRTMFYLPENFTSAGIFGYWAADNQGSIMLNGTTVVTTPDSCNRTAFGPMCYKEQLALQISSGFVAGINYLDFVVVNEVRGYGNPTGLWAALQGGYWAESQQPVPEPGTAATLGGGAAGLILLAMRRRRRG